LERGNVVVAVGAIDEVDGDEEEGLEITRDCCWDFEAKKD
jgi:hypothetical protein